MITLFYLLICMFILIFILLVFCTICYIMWTHAVITCRFFTAALLGWFVPSSLLRIAMCVVPIVATGISVTALVPSKRTSMAISMVRYGMDVSGCLIPQFVVGFCSSCHFCYLHYGIKSISHCLPCLCLFGSPLPDVVVT